MLGQALQAAHARARQALEERLRAAEEGLREAVETRATQDARIRQLEAECAEARARAEGLAASAREFAAERDGLLQQVASLEKEKGELALTLAEREQTLGEASVVAWDVMLSLESHLEGLVAEVPEHAFGPEELPRTLRWIKAAADAARGAATSFGDHCAYTASCLLCALLRHQGCTHIAGLEDPQLEMPAGTGVMSGAFRAVRRALGFFHERIWDYVGVATTRVELRKSFHGGGSVGQFLDEVPRRDEGGAEASEGAGGSQVRR